MANVVDHRTLAATESDIRLRRYFAKCTLDGHYRADVSQILTRRRVVHQKIDVLSPARHASPIVQNQIVRFSFLFDLRSVPICDYSDATNAVTKCVFRDLDVVVVTQTSPGSKDQLPFTRLLL